MVVPAKGLLCFGKNIRVTKLRGDSLLMEGPGFVFFELPHGTRTGISSIWTIGAVFLLILLVESVLTTILDLLI